MKLKSSVKTAITAAVYVALTVSFAPLSYGMVQVRFSEALMLLCCIAPQYGIALSLGCAVANLFGGFGLLDMIVGTLATILSAVCMGKTKSRFVASFWPVFWNGLLVGAELAFLTDTSPVLCILGVAAGEFLSVTVFGVFLFKLLEKTKFYSLL